MPTAELLTAALWVLVGPHPERGWPAADRLREMHPDAEETEIQAALGSARAVESRAYDLTAPSWPARSGTRWRRPPRLRSSPTRSLRREFEWLDGELLGRLINHAHYTHFRD